MRARTLLALLVPSLALASAAAAGSPGPDSRKLALAQAPAMRAGTEVQVHLSPLQRQLDQARSWGVLQKQLTGVQAPAVRAFLAQGAQDPALAGQRGRSFVLTFDEVFAPCIFLDTSPLAGSFLGQAAFAGTKDMDGGAVLDECSNFGLPALSTPNFLAFNRTAGYSNGGVPRVPEVVFLGSGHSEVSLHLSGGYTPGYPVAVVAFDSSGFLQDVRLLQLTAGWQKVTVSGADLSGFVLLGDPYYMVVDDIEVF